MLTIVYAVIAAAVIGLLCILLRAYLNFRGERLVECPETKAPVVVEVGAATAALTSLVGKPNLRIQDCSRWPEHKECDQACLTRIENAPEDCLVRTIVADWYRGKTCCYCGKEVSDLEWLEHGPCVRNPEGKTLAWKDIPSDDLAAVIGSYTPVCWNCHIAETFRREYPDLVVDRK